MWFFRRGLLSLMGAVIALAPLGAHAQQNQLTVLAAASLTDAFQEIAQRFEQSHAAKVILSFGASDMLAHQIIHGAPAHVFAAADQVAMDKVSQAEYLAPGSRVNFAANRLAFITPASSAISLHGIEDLENKEVQRIALANPDSVPAGRYAKHLLKTAKLWEATRSRQIFGQHVRQVLDYVARGEVDAGFVFATDAQQLADRVHIVTELPIPEDASYPIALTQLGANVKVAQEFLEFVCSDVGQNILQQYGFRAP